MEQVLVTTRATVLLYDDEHKRWIPSSVNGGQPPGVSKVQLLQNMSNNTFRIVGRRLKDHEVVLNVAIHRSVKFNQSTPLFQQWKDAKQVYGLQYEAKDEADAFGGAMSQVIQFLQQLHAQQKAVQGSAGTQLTHPNNDVHLYSPGASSMVSIQSSVSNSHSNNINSGMLAADGAMHEYGTSPTDNRLQQTQGSSPMAPHHSQYGTSTMQRHTTNDSVPSQGQSKPATSQLPAAPQQMNGTSNVHSASSFVLPPGVNIGSLDNQQLQLLMALQQNGMLVPLGPGQPQPAANGSANNPPPAANQSQPATATGPAPPPAAAPPPPPPPPPPPAPTGPPAPPPVKSSPTPASAPAPAPTPAAPANAHTNGESDSNNNAFAAALSNAKLRSIGRSATTANEQPSGPSVTATLPRRDSQATMRPAGDAMMDEMRQRIEARNKRQTTNSNGNANGTDNNASDFSGNGLRSARGANDKNGLRSGSPPVVNGNSVKADVITMSRKEFDEMKAEMFTEMRKELQKMKGELLDAIKMELIRK